MNDNDRIGWGLAILFALALPFCFGRCYAGSSYQVSDGTRDGVVRKMSDTGIIWTTTEVEMVGNAGLNPETFQFTVRDPDVKQQLADLPAGQKVRVTYRKFLTVWAPKGETKYEITGVQR